MFKSGQIVFFWDGDDRVDGFVVDSRTYLTGRTYVLILSDEGMEHCVRSDRVRVEG